MAVSSTAGGFTADAPEVVIRNSDDQRTIYVSTNSGVTPSSGFPLVSGETLSLAIVEQETIYLVTESGTARADYFYHEV